MEEKKTVKRMVTKPAEDAFAPPVAEIVEEELVARKPEPIKSEIPESKQTQIKWGLFYVGVLLLVLVIGVSGGLWWGYRAGLGLASPSPTPTLVAQATPLPTPTLVAIDRSTIVVDVLNGSGIVGKAGATAALVTALGYKKGTTGNAPLQAGSTIRFSEDVATLSATIMADISEIVPELAANDERLSGTNKARLILGSE